MKRWMQEIADEIVWELNDWVDTAQNPSWDKVYKKAKKVVRMYDVKGWVVSEIAEYVADKFFDVDVEDWDFY